MSILFISNVVADIRILSSHIASGRIPLPLQVKLAKLYADLNVELSPAMKAMKTTVEIMNRIRNDAEEAIKLGKGGLQYDLVLIASKHGSRPRHFRWWIQKGINSIYDPKIPKRYEEQQLEEVYLMILHIKHFEE